MESSFDIVMIALAEPISEEISFLDTVDEGVMQNTVFIVEAHKLVGGEVRIVYE